MKQDESTDSILLGIFLRINYHIHWWIVLLGETVEQNSVSIFFAGSSEMSGTSKYSKS